MSKLETRSIKSSRRLHLMGHIPLLILERLNEALDPWRPGLYYREIARKIGCSYTTLSKWLKLLLKLDLIQCRDYGSIHVYSLTEKGRQVAELLHQIERKLLEK